MNPITVEVPEIILPNGTQSTALLMSPFAYRAAKRTPIIAYHDPLPEGVSTPVDFDVNRLLLDMVLNNIQEGDVFAYEGKACTVAAHLEDHLKMENDKATFEVILEEGDPTLEPLIEGLRNRIDSIESLACYDDFSLSLIEHSALSCILRDPLFEHWNMILDMYASVDTPDSMCVIPAEVIEPWINLFSQAWLFEDAVEYTGFMEEGVEYPYQYVRHNNAAITNRMLWDTQTIVRDRPDWTGIAEDGPHGYYLTLSVYGFERTGWFEPIFLDEEAELDGQPMQMRSFSDFYIFRQDKDIRIDVDVVDVSPVTVVIPTIDYVRIKIKPGGKLVLTKNQDRNELTLSQNE